MWQNIQCDKSKPACKMNHSDKAQGQMAEAIGQALVCLYLECSSRSIFPSFIFCLHWKMEGQTGDSTLERLPHVHL